MNFSLIRADGSTLDACNEGRHSVLMAGALLRAMPDLFVEPKAGFMSAGYLELVDARQVNAVGAEYY